MYKFIRNATIEDFKRGYIWDCKKAEYICLICGEYIGENNDSINTHTANHGTPIEWLLMLEKKYTGLTEIQKEFLKMISNRYSDREISMKLVC